MFPDAPYKFYLNAAAEERARRRYKEQLEKGLSVTYEQVLEDINRRDYNDMHHQLNPLQKAEDAVEIDTTHMTIEEVVAAIVSAVQK